MDPLRKRTAEEIMAIKEREQKRPELINRKKRFSNNGYVDEIQEFLEHKKQGKLALQTTRNLFSTFFREVPLTFMKKVVFGSSVQLIATKMNVCDMYKEYMPALSVVVNEKRIHDSQQLNERCELTVAPSLKPCVRNVFIIKSGDKKNRDGEHLHYGQDFILECVEAEESPLVLFSAPKLENLTSIISTTYTSQNNYGEENQTVGLCVLTKTGAFSHIPTGHCKWRCLHENPKMRFETEGKDISTNEDLVIAHTATNRYLAAENMKISTVFGQECLVSAHSYLDMNKKQMWQNYWMLGTSQKG